MSIILWFGLTLRGDYQPGYSLSLPVINTNYFMSISKAELLRTLPQTGTLMWLSRRPQKNATVEVVSSLTLNVTEGLIGDHYSGRSGKRQVTLVQAEHLPAVAAMLGVPEIDPVNLRRNVVVSGINLLALRDRRFRIGDEVILEGSGACHPCSKMEENLGPGGYNAMRGHGGITARVIRGGTIRQGDIVAPVEESA